MQVRAAAVIVAAALVLMTFATFFPSVRNGFIALDDPSYIVENWQVQRGLGWETALWALRSTEQGNWYPLRRLTHLADVDLFGMWAGGHHLVSVAWHAGAAVLLFAALRLMTGWLWGSAAVAAMFAIHPLQVESVAWAAERSNVLAGFFFGLTLLLWARYARRPEAGRYGTVLASLALGLAAKPVLVTLPPLLLVLDVWPLGRARSWRRLGVLALEKLPLLPAAAGAAAMAVIAHRQAGALHTLEALPLGARLANAAVSYWRYLGKVLWPAELAVYYPHPGRGVSLGLVVLAVLALAAVTGLALAGWRRRPWLSAGWLWFVGSLVPMIGVVQFGNHAMADRFAYLSLAGPALALAWESRRVLSGFPRRGRVLLPVVAAALTASFAAMAVSQLRLWRDSETLFTRALANTSGNFVVHASLGDALYRLGRADEAIAQYRKALELKPYLADTHNNLGTALAALGRFDEAIAQYRLALMSRPEYESALTNLGSALAAQGRTDEAIARYQEALRLKPDSAETRNNLGAVLAASGRTDEAIAQYRKALEIRPGYARASANLGDALAGSGRTGEALAHYRIALDLAVRQGRKGLAEEVRAKLAAHAAAGAAPRPPAAGPQAGSR